MDDRMFGAKLGKPIPEWDLEHRLPITGWVGPDLRDGATTFRLNSVFLDATDQPHMIRQWYAGAILVAVFAVVAFGCVIAAIVAISASRNWPQEDIVSLSIPLASVVGFGWFALHFGRQEFFARTRYPIRFNRKMKKIYALVRTRGRGRHGHDGDCVEEIDWSKTSIFCIHHASQDGYHYWIRHYRTDMEGNVVKAVTIGRDWEGIEGLEELLAQWNYWCWFMNKGPSELPKPGLFLPENESLHESFLYCVYQLGFRASPAFRLIFLPVIVLLASHRAISLWTCSSPRWPSRILAQCKVSADDPFDEPKGSTPVGWHATDLAILQGKYPELQSKKIDDWNGESDSRKNALMWAECKVAHRGAPSRI